MDSIVIDARPESAPLVKEPEIPELDFLRTRICEGLSRHEALAQKAATTCVDAIENSVRIGWNLQDAFTLIGSGRWSAWVKANLSIGIDRARRLRKLGSYFSRDLTDHQLRKSRGFAVSGLAVAIGPSLREQIAASGVKSSNELMRLLKLKPESATQKSAQPKRATLPSAEEPPLPRKTAAGAHAVHGGNGAAAPPAPTPLDGLIVALQEVQRRMEMLDPAQLTYPERATISRWFVPLDRAYHRLMGAKTPLAPQTGLPPAERLIRSLENVSHQLNLLDTNRLSAVERRQLTEALTPLSQAYTEIQALV